MKVYRLEQSENGRTRPLYEEVFSEDSRAFVDYYYREKTKDNQIYVVEEDEEICAMLHLNPYTLMVNGTEKEANYIVAVATRQSFRGRGYMTRLLEEALRDMYHAGQSFTFLMPAAEAIYLPHGFRTVCEQDRRIYEESAAVPADTTVSQLLPEECGELSQAANAWLGARYQVFAKRDAAYYQRLIAECASDGGKLMLYRRNGEICDLRVFFPEEEGGNPKIMVRIVDVRRMLMSMQVKSLIAACFTVTDPVIEENNRCVVITGTEFSGVMLMDGKVENSEGTIPVDALASLLFGEKTADGVCGMDGVKMSERLRGELEKIVPLSRIYLNEVV